MEDKFRRQITAKEAREIADKTPTMLAKIYKEINYAANNGAVALDWDIVDCSQILVENIADTLRKNDYIVNFDDDEDGNYFRMIIRW